MKVNVDLKTIDAINNTDIATAHQTKNYHQLRLNLGNTRNRFDQKVDDVVKFLLSYDEFRKLKPDQRPKATAMDIMVELRKINPKIHQTDWLTEAKLTKFNPTRTQSHRKED